ncbi:Transcriptional activator protein acu-15 [Cytospora mali]|uniref:Transcriptional activator protein acu-15 n=1 Tax=Cytospora mali TaxID=578113 RepID=A0A194VEI1_CYTMA|nr:Transcriptional activator protein acu-15 [Valsa mali var. pyri (nom. inval.)]
MASECKRSILSCLRCRKRKMRCDRQLPSCSQCLSAKANCTGISANAESDVPRSIVQHLESEIARLETELLQDGQLEVVHASDILLQMPFSLRPGADTAERTSACAQGKATEGVHSGDKDLRTSIMSSASLQAIVSATLPYGSGATDLLSRVRMGMTPSSAKVGEKSSRTTAINPKANKGSILLDPTILRSIPGDIVQRLMRKYLNTIHRDNPFLVTSEVMDQFNNVAGVFGWQAQTPAPSDGPLSVIASHDFLVVYLVLAISVTLGSANDGHEERCMALSMSLFEEGIRHLYSLPSFPSDIAWLQTILLVLLYATVCPRSANVWVLSGAAMRSCLELGLHREPPDSMALDTEAIELRRRVFWAAYCMDRSICSALQLPLSTPDEAINTKLPSPTQDPFQGSIVYQKLLSEILHASSHYENADFKMARGMMMLYRPSPRVPSPSSRSLLLAFEAAATAERIHREHIQAGFFRRPWLSAHHTLEAATVVLFCLRHGYAAVTERFSAAQVFDMTKLFTSNFLAIAAHGWPEVSVYAGIYERLLGPLLERVFLRNSVLGEQFGPAQDAELMRLLYPGPAHLDNLRFGLRQQQEEFSPFDFNLFMGDDEVWTSGLDLGAQVPDEGEQQWDMGLPTAKFTYNDLTKAKGGQRETQPTLGDCRKYPPGTLASPAAMLLRHPFDHPGFEARNPVKLLEPALELSLL